MLLTRVVPPLLLVVFACCPALSVAVWAQGAKPVLVARVTEAEVKASQRFVGSVQPLRTSTIGSAVDGRVKTFLVNQGDPVKKGQTLAQLRTETLEIEKAAAKAELDLATQRLAELQNGSRPEDIAEADSNMRAAKAALNFAERQRDRIKLLAESLATSSTELDLARERSEAAKFALKASEALLKRIKDGPRVETIAQGKAQVELQKQRLALINDRITKSTITAPFDGFVSAEYSEVGSWIDRGDPIAQVIQMDEVEIHTPVTAQSVVGLRRGDVIRIEFPELPDELLIGKVKRIVPVANSRARTFPVHIRIKNRVQDGTPLLMAGMLARVLLPAGKRQKLPTVPKDALVLNGDDRAVFVVDGSTTVGTKSTGTVRKVNVSLGVAVDDRIQVRGDIKVGDLVVVGGNERLIPNTRVEFAQKEVTR